MMRVSPRDIEFSISFKCCVDDPPSTIIHLKLRPFFRDANKLLAVRSNSVELLYVKVTIAICGIGDLSHTSLLMIEAVLVIFELINQPSFFVIFYKYKKERNDENMEVISHIA